MLGGKRDIKCSTCERPHKIRYYGDHVLCTCGEHISTDHMGVLRRRTDAPINEPVPAPTAGGGPPQIMPAEVERFAAALNAGAILAEDF